MSSFPVFTPQHRVSDVCNALDKDTLSVVLEYALHPCDNPKCPDGESDAVRRKGHVSFTQGPYTWIYCDIWCFGKGMSLPPFDAYIPYRNPNCPECNDVMECRECNELTDRED